MIPYKEFVQQEKYIVLRHNPELYEAGLLRHELDQCLAAGQKIFYYGSGSDDPSVIVDPTLIRSVRVGDQLYSDFWFPNREEFNAVHGRGRSLVDVGVCNAYHERYNGHRLFARLDDAKRYHHLVGTLPILHKDLTNIRRDYLSRGRSPSSW